MSKLRDERGRKRRRGRAVEGSIEMGRKAGVMRVNPKHLTRRTMPCFQEMLVFLSCLHKFNYDDDKVVKEKNALNMCMDVQFISGKWGLGVSGKAGQAAQHHQLPLAKDITHNERGRLMCTL